MVELLEHLEKNKYINVNKAKTEFMKGFSLLLDSIQKEL